MINFKTGKGPTNNDEYQVSASTSKKCLFIAESMRAFCYDDVHIVFEYITQTFYVLCDKI